MDEVVILGGARTAIGAFGKSLKDVPAAELGATVIKAALERSGVSPDQVDEVVMGCVGQIGKDAYIGRVAAVTAGLPVGVTAMNVNRLCGSGLQAINTAAQEVISGAADIVVAGGTENMSRFPYLVDARWGLRLGDAGLVDAMVAVLSDPFSACHMGITAENVAKRWGVDRQAQDEFALESQRRTARAQQNCWFADQIVPVEIKERKGVRVFDRDEHPRPDTTLEGLASLRPAFDKSGSVTAGNASGINDAAAAVVVTSARKAQELGLKPKLRLVAQAVAGVDPDVMGVGPIPAVRKVLQKAGMTADQIDQIELNEAFAAQALAVIRELELDPERVNPNGGAIALGHPIGATGAILTVKLMYELERRGDRFGMVTACIGGGQGIATIFERLD